MKNYFENIFRGTFVRKIGFKLHVRLWHPKHQTLDLVLMKLGDLSTSKGHNITH